MIKILIIGYSEIVRRRIIPALVQIGVNHIDIASRTRINQVDLPEGVQGTLFDDYETAFSQSKADVVYISTTNNTHAALAEKALNHILSRFHCS